MMQHFGLFNFEHIMCKNKKQNFLVALLLIFSIFCISIIMPQGYLFIRILTGGVLQAISVWNWHVLAVSARDHRSHFSHSPETCKCGELETQYCSVVCLI